MSDYKDLSDVGLLATLIMERLKTMPAILAWVKSHPDMASLRTSLSHSSVSSMATRLSSLLVGRGYINQRLIDEIGELGSEAQDAMVLLCQKRGLVVPFAFEPDPMSLLDRIEAYANALSLGQTLRDEFFTDSVAADLRRVILVIESINAAVESTMEKQ